MCDHGIQLSACLMYNVKVITFGSNFMQDMKVEYESLLILSIYLIASSLLLVDIYSHTLKFNVTDCNERQACKV